MLAIKVIATVLIWLIAVQSAKIHLKEVDPPTFSGKVGVYLGMVGLHSFITYAVWA